MLSVISARKAKHLDVTTMFTYSYANTPLGQSERAYYLSYFKEIFDSLRLGLSSSANILQIADVAL